MKLYQQYKGWIKSAKVETMWSEEGQGHFQSH